MSARIPDTLLVSEVLKPTGFDCPEDLEGVSFNEAVSGSTSAELEDNKEVSITENGTIEITPTAGHDYAGMKKVTANVNVAGGGSGVNGFAIEFGNGAPFGRIDSKVIAFGTAQAMGGTIPSGTYNAFFVTDDVREGETHDFTDIPHLFQESAKVSASLVVTTNPPHYTVTISEAVTPVVSGNREVHGRRALLVLYPSNM